MQTSMSILVVGSVAFDSVKTPFGEVTEILGGSASYFSVSASFFAPVNLVAVIGDDFPQEHLDLFQKFSIDTRGLQRVPGKTFRWAGEYGFALNEAITLDTQLNVFESFKPEIPAGYRNCEYVFLGNIDPVLQREVLSQVSKPKFVACDTMNYWITSKPEELRKTLTQVDILIINDAEARMLTDQPNITKAARTICSWGPKILVVKKGEYEELPELNEELLARGEVKRGGRPVSANPRKLLSIRLPADVIDRWKATGPGWQTRMADRLSTGAVKNLTGRSKPTAVGRG